MARVRKSEVENQREQQGAAFVQVLAEGVWVHHAFFRMQVGGRLNLSSAFRRFLIRRVDDKPDFSQPSVKHVEARGLLKLVVVGSAFGEALLFLLEEGEVFLAELRLQRE